MLLPSVFDSLNALQKLTEGDVTLSGAWTFPNQVHRIWVGEAVAEIPIVGMAFLRLGEHIFWHKSNQAAKRLVIRLVLQPLLRPHDYQFIAYLGSYNANHDTIAMLNESEDLPEVPSSRLLKTGQLFQLPRLNRRLRLRCLC